MKFTTDQYVSQIEFYYSNKKSPTLAARAFNTHCRNNNIRCPPAKQTDITRTVKKFTKKGTINRYYVSSGRSTSVLTDDNCIAVFGQMTDSRDRGTPYSIRNCAKDVNMSSLVSPSLQISIDLRTSTHATSLFGVS